MVSEQELIEILIRADKLDQELNRADKVICMSDVLKEACRQVGIASEKLVTLGNRVNLKRFYPLEQKNYDPKTIHVLFIGRLEKQKNVHGIVQALLLLKSQGWQVKLEICGGRQMNSYLKEAISPLCSGEWRYWGSVPNRRLPKIYQQVDMYVGPSFFEGFQIPLIEALACGKPCVASHQPPASEIINAELGALVDPEQPASIAEGIRNVKERLNDPRQGATLRQACRSSALARWDYFVVSKREAELYMDVLQGHKYTNKGSEKALLCVEVKDRD